MTRKIFDCRWLGGECTLAISGEEEEVVKAQAQHAVAVHGQEETQDLRDRIRAQLKDEMTEARR